MILIKGFGDFAKVEQLFPELNDEAMDKIETLEASGFVVSIQVLPSHVKTPEQHAAMLLEQFTEMYLPQTKNVDKGPKFH